MNRGLALFFPPTVAWPIGASPLPQPTWASTSVGLEPVREGVRRGHCPPSISSDAPPSSSFQRGKAALSHGASRAKAVEPSGQGEASPPILAHETRRESPRVPFPPQFLLAAAGFVPLPSPVLPRPTRSFLQFAAVGLQF